jgi:hypothetical protein
MSLEGEKQMYLSTIARLINREDLLSHLWRAIKANYGNNPIELIHS